MADADRALAETLGRFGLDAVTSQPNLCRNTLRDKMPDHPREIALLITALEAGVPTRLATESRISDVDTVAAQLAKGLERSHGLSPDSARWAVQGWVKALELSPTAPPPASPADSSLEAGTILREQPADPDTAPRAAAPDTAPRAAAPDTAPRAAAPDTAPRAGAPDTAPRAGAPDTASASPAGGGSAGQGVDAPRAGTMPTSEETIRPTTAPTTAPTGGAMAGAASAAATPPRSGIGRWAHGRRLGFVVGAVVLIGVVVGVVLATSGGSAGGPSKAPGAHGKSSSSVASGSASSATSSTTSSSGSKSAAGFVPLPPVIAHEGGADGYAEETLPAFVNAARQGFTAESDVRWTRDGVPILAHDTNTKVIVGLTCRGGPYTVATTTWAVLRDRCRFAPSASPKTHRAYAIPTFDATVEQLSKMPHATLFAELKTDQTPAQNKQYLAILRKWHMLTRTVVTSYFTPYLANFASVARAEHAKIRTLRFAKQGNETTVSELQHAHIWGVCPVVEWGPAASLIAAARQVGIHVGIDTSTPGSDTPAGWADAKKLHPEFVLTNRPGAYHSWLATH